MIYLENLFKEYIKEHIMNGGNPLTTSDRHTMFIIDAGITKSIREGHTTHRTNILTLLERNDPSIRDLIYQQILLKAATHLTIDDFKFIKKHLNMSRIEKEIIIAKMIHTTLMDKKLYKFMNQNMNNPKLALAYSGFGLIREENINIFNFEDISFHVKFISNVNSIYDNERIQYMTWLIDYIKISKTLNPYQKEELITYLKTRLIIKKLVN